jgi:hypothetical protein
MTVKIEHNSNYLEWIGRWSMRRKTTPPYVGILGFGWVNRQSAQQQPADQSAQQPKPENAKEMYRQKDVQDRAALKPMNGMPEQPKADLETIKTRMEKASQHLNQGVPAPSTAPADSTASPEPSRQKMDGQDKAAPELSPTSLQAGKTSLEKDAASPSPEKNSTEQVKPSPTPSPSHTPSPGGRGGWER